MGKISVFFVIDFFRLSEEDIGYLIVGVYQLKFVLSYIREYLDSDGSFDVLICNYELDLFCVKIQLWYVLLRGY